MSKVITKSKSKLTRDSYENRVHSRPGMKFITGGMFANVYAMPKTNRVVKIGTPDEDHYLEYVEMVGLRNPNQHLPYITEVLVARDYYKVVMERLIEYYDVNEMMRNRAVKLAGVEFYWQLRTPDAINPKTDDAKELKRIMRRLERDYSNNLDIHDGNVMFRKQYRKYDLVLTDPVS